MYVINVIVTDHLFIQCSLNKLHRDAVHTIPFPRWFRAIIEDVAKMSITLRTSDLRTH